MTHAADLNIWLLVLARPSSTHACWPSCVGNPSTSKAACLPGYTVREQVCKLPSADLDLVRAALAAVEYDLSAAQAVLAEMEGMRTIPAQMCSSAYAVFCPGRCLLLPSSHHFVDGRDATSCSQPRRALCRV